MFEHLAKYRKILVTGPHRSGTTFAATAIAHDTGHGLIREELSRFNPRLLRAWLQESPSPVVCQAPYAADICHTFGDVLVVWMVRDVSEIEASQARMRLEDGAPVNWSRIEAGERRRYHANEPIAAVKYRNWPLQRAKIARYLNLEYESLRDHPLWIAPEFRVDFHVRQTSVD